MVEPRILMSAEPEPTSSTMTEEPERRRHTWNDKFRVALRGIKFGVRGQSSFFVHFFVTAMVLAAAIVLECSLIQWCLLLGCIGFVLAMELVNSAIETLFHGQDEETKKRTWQCLDIAAGAVLIASLTASLVGAMILLYQLGVLLGWDWVRN